MPTKEADPGNFLAIAKYALPSWKEKSNGDVSQHSVLAGEDNGSAVYVGIAEHSGDVIPGKVIPNHNTMYISFEGKEICKDHYQVLHNPSRCALVWIEAKDGSIPTGALQGGQTSSGETLYIAKCQIDGNCVVGKVHPSHGTAYFPYGGEEIGKSEYEVLCMKECNLVRKEEHDDD